VVGSTRNVTFPEILENWTRVSVAVPDESEACSVNRARPDDVVAGFVEVIVPRLVCKVTEVPSVTRLLFASIRRAVISVVVAPSAAILEGLAVTDEFVGTGTPGTKVICTSWLKPPTLAVTVDVPVLVPVFR